MAEQEIESKSEVVNIINIEKATSTQENQKPAAVGTEGTSNNNKKEDDKVEDDQKDEAQDPQPNTEHDDKGDEKPPEAEAAVAETPQEGAGNEAQESATGSDAKSPVTEDQKTETKPVAHSAPVVELETPSEDYYEFNRSDVAYESSRIMVIVRTKPGKPADDAAQDSVGVANGVGGRPEDAVEEVAPDMEHFRQLFREGKLCDLRIKSGDAVLEIHRVVLTAQSPKYLEQFKRQDGAGPGAISEVTLKDVDPSTVRTVIDYLYSGVVAFSEKTVDGIVNCAVQLDLQALVKECVKFLSDFSVDTVLGHLQVTVEYGLTGMVDTSAMIRLCAENFALLAETVEFRELTHKTLSLLLSHEELHQVGEDLLLKATCRWFDRDPTNRTPLIVSLLEKIRLEEASPVLIEQLIEENSALSALPEVKKMLCNAYK